MLFGIERQRGRASKNDTYSRFEPWSGTGAYQGWLRLESQGEIFRIERRFQKGNKSLTIINETKGCEETPTAALWERLRCGLSETALPGSGLNTQEPLPPFLHFSPVSAALEALSSWQLP